MPLRPRPTARCQPAARAREPRRPGHRVHRGARAPVPAADAGRRSARRSPRCGPPSTSSTRVRSTARTALLRSHRSARQRAGAAPAGDDRRGRGPRPWRTPACRRRRRCGRRPTPTPPERSPTGDTVLARPTTSPEDVAGMIAARGVVTERGGSTSHAAVVTRALGRPSVVGVGDDVTSGWVGREVTVDGSSGVVYAGLLQTEDRPGRRIPGLWHLLPGRASCSRPKWLTTRPTRSTSTPRAPRSTRRPRPMPRPLAERLRSASAGAARCSPRRGRAPSCSPACRVIVRLARTSTLGGMLLASCRSRQG